MEIAIAIAIAGIAVGIGLSFISKAISNNNSIKQHEIHLKRFHYMD